ncbi:MAG: hypothetical protein V1717_00005, partial [Candidatus Micrarchaeota archaeon]
MKYVKGVSEAHEKSGLTLEDRRHLVEAHGPAVGLVERIAKLDFSKVRESGGPAYAEAQRLLRKLGHYEEALAAAFQAEERLP